MKAKVDPVTLEIVRASLVGIVREMQGSLFRTGFSTIIRESHDCSCALTDTKGNVVAVHAHIFVHFGVFPDCAKSVLRHYSLSDIHEGDAFIINQPYEGSRTHVADMAIITPVFYKGELVAFCANMAHKSDLGGMVPGSCPGNSTEIFQEGLMMPGIRLFTRSGVTQEMSRIITANSRTPELVMGDILGQVGTNRLGVERLQAMMEKFGKDTCLAAFSEIIDRTEQQTRNKLLEWPDATGVAESFAGPDPLSGLRKIRVAAVKERDHILFDFTGTDLQSQGPFNALPSVVAASCWWALMVMFSDHSLLFNSGLSRSVAVRIPEGTFLNPRFPAAIASYASVLQFVAQTALTALSHITGKVIAWFSGGAGLSMSGINPRDGRPYLQYEMGGGGSAAVSGRDGITALGIPTASGCALTPVEIVESEFPVRLRRFELIPDSGGDGQYRGGLAYAREYLILTNGVKLINRRGTKDIVESQGVAGGNPGACGTFIVNPDDESKKMVVDVPAVTLSEGDVLRLETRGGGGVGDPRRRDPMAVQDDLENGFVSSRKAVEVYGYRVPQEAEPNQASAQHP